MKYFETLPKMKDVYESEKRKLFTVVSTFAGCGGSSTGYRLAGANILAINEFIPAAIETYKVNYPNTIIFPEDIRELTGQIILDKVGLKKGELDLLDGSPPCASFSISGKREKGWGKVKKYSDTEQRTDDLFFEFIRILNEIQPKVFVAENVEGLTLGGALNLLGTKQNDLFGEHEKTFLYHFEQCGYRVQYHILNARDFGVPQRRSRLIIIGVRQDLEIAPSFPLPWITKRVTVREALEGVENSEKDIEESKKGLTEGYETYKYVIQLKPGESGSKYHPKGSYFSLTRLEWDKECNTVLQSHGHTGGCACIYPDENRRLTIKEIKRVCSFPDDFILTGDFNQQWERCGRAVPPLFMRAIANNVYENIIKKIREKEGIIVEEDINVEDL